MRRWPTRIEGDLDEHTGGLLPAGADDLLGFTQARRPGSNTIPHSQCAHACGLGRFAMARAATTRRARGVAGSSPLGCAPGHGAIGRVGNGVKKYAVVPVLSIVDLLLSEGGRLEDRRAFALVAVRLGAAFLCPGDCE